MRNSFSSHEPILNSDEEQLNELKKPEYSFDSIFLNRFFRLLKVLFNWKGLNKVWSTSKKARKNSIFWLYMTFISLSIIYQVVVYYVGMIPSNFYSILTGKDIIRFRNYLLPCLFLVFSAATVSLDFYFKKNIFF